MVEQPQGLIEGGLDVLLVVGDGFGPLLQLSALGLDAGLLGGQHLGIYEVLVAELQQPLLLLREFAQAPLCAVGLLAGGFELLLGVMVDAGTDAFLRGRAEPDVTLVVALDGAFDVIDGHVWPKAGRISGQPSAQAGEVVVEAAFAFDAHEDQAAAADAAVDRSLQVVLVLAGAVTTERVRLQDGLDSLEGLDVDQGRMQPIGVLDAVERHHADVIVVTQHPVDAAALHRSGWPLGGHRQTQPSDVQQVGQGADRVLASGISLESHSHQRRTVRVKLHDTHVAAQHPLAHVQIADACRPRRTAHRVLALQSHLDLLGIPGRAELVDRRHHAVRQPAARGLVDVLKHRDELGPGLLDLEHQQRVIEPVARQPGQVIDDHVGWPQLRQRGQHPLQGGPVGGAATDAVLHELADDPGRKRLSARLGRLPLPRDRVPLRVSAAIDLPRTRYPQVDDGGLGLRLRRGHDRRAHRVTPR
jgi:hypothetical protein